MHFLRSSLLITTQMKVVLNNSLTHYIDIGISTAAPVVFIHGFPFSHKMWTFPGGQTEALAGTHRVVAYDVCGHGESEVSSGHYSIEFFVDDLIGLLNHLNIQQAIVVGLSMGGYIALRAIEKHPDRFKGLVLCDTRSEADSNEGKIQRAVQINSIKSEGVKPFAEEYIKNIFAPESMTERNESVRLIQSIIERTAPSSLFGTLLALAARTDTTDSLSSIKVPTCIIVGEKDVLTPVSAAEKMKENIPHAAVTVIPNAAHISNMENPEAFNKALVEFLQTFQ